MEGGNESAITDPQSEEEITMTEFLEEQEKLEKDAHVVLGGSDHTNCTYTEGYVSRQALYACVTCTTPATPSTGVCLACSYDCHDGHELVELYTKRNFRCDCGNSRMPDTKCKLFPNKDRENEKNRYNHNFRGTYCTCDRPYPDPEDQVDDVMIQCIVCEDWYHGRHLGGSRVPDSDEYDEMVCGECMKRHEFLWFYSAHSAENVNVTLRKEEEAKSRSVDVEADSQPTSKGKPAGCSKSESETTANVTSAPQDTRVKCESDAQVATATKQPDEEPAGRAAPCAQEAGESQKCEPQCLLDDLKTRDALKCDRKSNATFWAAGWRQKLCTCAKCKVLYAREQLDFLLDESDPVHVYEAKAPETQPSQYDQGMQALSTLDRVHQVEALHEYNDLKSELKDYLAKFAQNGKVVREDDIREFFTQMSARKRQKTTSAPGIQYFCK